MSDGQLEADVPAGARMSSLTTLGRADHDQIDLGPFDTAFFPEVTAADVAVGARPLHRTPLGRSVLFADVVALSMAVVLVAAAQASLHPGAGYEHVVGGVERLVACLPVMAVALARSRQRLRRRLTTTLAQEVHDVALPLAAATLACIAGWRLVAGVGGTVGPPDNSLLFTCATAVVVVALARVAFRSPTGAGGERARRVLFVGSGAVADRVRCQLESAGGVRVVGFVDDDPKDATGCLGSLEELLSVCEHQSVDHLVVAFSRAQAEDIVDALRPLQGRMPISVVPRLFDVLPPTADAHDLVSGYPAISVAPSATHPWQGWIKRVVDVIGASVALLALAPVLAVASVGVRLSSRGPVLLRQVRVGRNGREFTIWKFRTFTVTEQVTPPDVLASGEQVTGPFPKLKHDPRITAFGRVLRRSSIDETPQLLNVLLGSMSLVGPRPLAPDYAWNFDRWALRRYEVRPGLTGLWQVSGRNDLTYEEMCRLDSLYVTSWSLGLDARIMVRTVRAVTSGHGCY